MESCLIRSAKLTVTLAALGNFPALSDSMMFEGANQSPKIIVRCYHLSLLGLTAYDRLRTLSAW